MSEDRGKATLAESNQVACGNCSKEYPGPELKPVWEGDGVQWICPSCGSLHDGITQDDKRISKILR